MTDSHDSLADHDARSVELGAWKQLLTNAPDLRWGKVMAIRESILNGRYDEAQRMDATLEAMLNDIGVLCRRENQPVPDPT